MEDYFYERLTDRCNDMAPNSVTVSYWRLGEEMWRISLAKKRYFFLQNLREIETLGKNVKKY